MKEKKPGVIERSSDKLRRAAAVIGLVALAGTVIAPELVGIAASSGLVWLGADYVKNSSKEKRNHA